MDDQTTDRNEAIRARAHEIWESEGCPEGRESEHWARAEAEIAEASDGMEGEAAPVSGKPSDEGASEMMGEAELGAAPARADAAPAKTPKPRKPRRPAGQA